MLRSRFGVIGKVTVGIVDMKILVTDSRILVNFDSFLLLRNLQENDEFEKH